jgi:hypothetical protein
MIRRKSTLMLVSRKLQVENMRWRSVPQNQKAIRTALIGSSVKPYIVGLKQALPRPASHARHNLRQKDRQS